MDSGGFSVPPCGGLLGAASEITAGDPPAALGRELWEGSLGTHFCFCTIKGLGKGGRSANDLVLNPGRLGDRRCWIRQECLQLAVGILGVAFCFYE